VGWQVREENALAYRAILTSHVREALRQARLERVAGTTVQPPDLHEHRIIVVGKRYA
jgi:hypothetical protein